MRYENLSKKDLEVALLNDKEKLNAELTRLKSLPSITTQDSQNIMSLVRGIETINEDLRAISRNQPRPEHFFDYLIMIQEIDARSGTYPSASLPENLNYKADAVRQKNLGQPNTGQSNKNTVINQLAIDLSRLKKELYRLQKLGTTHTNNSNILSLELGITNIDKDIFAISHNLPRPDNFFDYQIMINEINIREAEELKSSLLTHPESSKENTSDATRQNSEESTSNASGRNAQVNSENTTPLQKNILFSNFKNLFKKIISKPSEKPTLKDPNNGLK